MAVPENKCSSNLCIGNCSCVLFLGGKERSTLKEISETLGRKTIDQYNTSDTRSSQPKEAAGPPIPSINVKVYPQARRNENDKLLGFASVTIGGVFAVNSLRLMDSEKGPFVAMPSRKDKDGNYHDICLSITSEMHKALNKAVIEGYKEAVAELNSRGAEVAQKASMRDQLKSVQREATARTADVGAR